MNDLLEKALATPLKGIKECEDFFHDAKSLTEEIVTAEENRLRGIALRNAKKMIMPKYWNKTLKDIPLDAEAEISQWREFLRSLGLITRQGNVHAKVGKLMRLVGYKSTAISISKQKGSYSERLEMASDPEIKELFGRLAKIEEQVEILRQFENVDPSLINTDEAIKAEIKKLIG